MAPKTLGLTFGSGGSVTEGERKARNEVRPGED